MAQRNAAKLSDEELLTDWQRWGERTRHEMITLAWNRRMFRMMREVLERNERLQATGGHVFRWMIDNYVVAAAMTFRRELDRQAGTENLRHLLAEMSQRPQVINRKWIVGRWQAPDKYDLIIANGEFDKHGIVKVDGNPNADHLDPAVIDADRAELEKQTERVRQYIERTYAHRAPQDPKLSAASITFDEFHTAVDAMIPIFQKYYWLLTGVVVMAVEPVPQYNTHECFTFLWWDAAQGPSKE